MSVERSVGRAIIDAGRPPAFLMPRSVRLRPWQKAALDAFWAAPRPDFLAVATPGAGKTTFALTAARQALAAATEGRSGRLVVVAPTQHLKVQWARNAAAFDLHLEPFWSSSDGRLPPDMHGIVTTYQQVATSAQALRQLAGGAFVIFDELHHAGDDRAWGDGIQHAFEVASRRLALSGTPFRSDTVAIPFVRYSSEVAQPDFEYGYGEALESGGVVRPVFFPRIDGHMEWVAPDGSLQGAAFADPLDRARAGQRLRTALSLEGEWLPAVLRQAHDQLEAIRVVTPDAAGLVIATDQDHARGIGAMLRERFGVRATVVTSDDPTASSRITAFTAGDDPWIVAVRMVSEGVDIPRLHVGVYATTTTTELFFRQAVGRIVRWTKGERRQRAYLFIPDEARLRALAFGIAEQRRHSLARSALDPSLDGSLEASLVGDIDPTVDPRPGMVEQLSLFSALSAVPIGEGHRPVLHGEDPTSLGGWPAVWSGSDGDGVEVDLPPLPVRSGGGRAGAVGEPRPGAWAGSVAVAGAFQRPPIGGGGTLREHKKRLRDDNAEVARRLARLTGLTHAQVNRELNRLTGLERVTEATAEQLERRLRHAEGWRNRIVPTPGQ